MAEPPGMTVWQQSHSMGGAVVNLKVKSSEDLGAGLVFLAVGVGAIYLAREYPIGEAVRMGPGFFPTWLGAILAVFGVFITVMSFRFESESGEPIAWSLRPWLILPGSIAVFGIMMHLNLGFVPALVVLVIGCSLAHKDVHLLETLLLCILIPAACVLIFAYGLGIHYRLFWWG